MKVLTIGGATYDVFLGYPHQQTAMINAQQSIVLPEGQKFDLESVYYHVGGGAANSAVSFARLGLETSSFFKIGADFQGSFIVDQLKKEPIELYYLVSEHEKTSSSFIITPSSGNSSILVYRGANSTLVKQEMPLDLIAQQDQLYITSLSGPGAQLLPYITKYAHDRKIPVAVNPGGGQLKYGMQSLCDALPNIDIFILNAHESSLFLNALEKKTVDFDISYYMKTVLACGPQIAVVTDGACGVYVGHGNEIMFHKSLPVTVISTVGAGDAFGSCFVAYCAQGKSIEDAVRAGIVNSASVVSCLSAQEGLLDMHALEQKMKTVDHSFLSRYPRE
jgi:sugar/nucleoside kinase (ribokinase family)